MKNQFTLNIKTPCQEDFNTFSATPNGGFCSSCVKEVVDFTKVSNEDIVNYFSTKNTNNTCGRFKAHQLNTPIVNPQQRKRFGLLSGIGLACLSLFSISIAQAQDNKNQKMPNGSSSETKASKFQNKILVKGNVSDGSGVILGVNVVLQGTSIGVQTDFSGNFEFPEKLKKGDVLVFSYIGMDSQKVVIENDDSTSIIELKVDMKQDSVILMGKIAVKEVYKSKRNK